MSEMNAGKFFGKTVENKLLYVIVDYLTKKNPCSRLPWPPSKGEEGMETVLNHTIVFNFSLYYAFLGVKPDCFGSR